jgi:hypothetical protein
MKSSRRISIRILIITLFLTLLFMDAQRQVRPQQAPTRSGALEALEFWTSARAYPESDIAPDKYYQAFLHVQTHMPKAYEPLRSDGVWQFIGPTNFSGRMISVAINPLNPGTVYAGAASGGLWRSHTGGLGSDWHRVPTGFPVLGVNAIAVDPADTNTVYIGTGEVYRYQGSVGGTVVRTTRGSYGMGILKSTDNGASWTKALDWSYNQQRGVQALRFNPMNSQTVFAATSEGVYRSPNGGTTWSLVLATVMARDIAIHSADTTQVLATCGNFASPGNGVYRSTDGGLTFGQISQLPPFSGMGVLGVSPSNPNFVYALLADSTHSVGTMYKSTDFGFAWTLVADHEQGDVQGWYARFLAVHPNDSDRIVIGAQGIYRSTDGGSTIAPIGSFFSGWADYHSFAYHPTDPRILYVVDDGGVWRTINFGQTYTDVGVGLQTSQFYNGFSSSTEDSLLALGQAQDHFGWMYTGSSTWVEGGVDEVGWTAINQSDNQIMYAGTRSGGTIAKSTNGGASFSNASTGLIGGISSWNSPFLLSPSDPSHLYFGRSIIFRTTNSAGNWSPTNGGMPLDGNPALSMAMSYTNTDTVYVGTAPHLVRAHVFRTTDAGASWADITGPLPDRYPLDIAVDPTKSSTVYVAFGGFNAGHLYKTTDAGASWVDITGILPDVPATAVVVDPLRPEVVYAGTDVGVFVSKTGGEDWMVWSEGLPEAVMISDLSLSLSNGAVRAVTHGAGVFERGMLETPTGTHVDETAAGRDVVLLPNEPNPFHSSTVIRFVMPSAGRVQLSIYDVSGRAVATLVEGEREAGFHSVRFDASTLSSGVYFYRLATHGFTVTRRMVVMK